jgi:hypothetical protein
MRIGVTQSRLFEAQSRVRVFISIDRSDTSEKNGI